MLCTSLCHALHTECPKPGAACTSNNIYTDPISPSPHGPLVASGCRSTDWAPAGCDLDLHDQCMRKLPASSWRRCSEGLPADAAERRAAQQGRAGAGPRYHGIIVVPKCPKLQLSHDSHGIPSFSMISNDYHLVI